MSQCRLFVAVSRQLAHDIAAVLDPWCENAGLSAALFEDNEVEDLWCWSVYVDESEAEQTETALREQLGDLAASLTFERETIDDIDWVAATLRDLAPVEAGRFFIHGSHDRHLATDKRLPVQIDAGLAFGTGHHGTTAGCLDVLEMVLATHAPRQAMDVGTGSGVLAIALAKAARVPVLASDIDPVAVRVARCNSEINGTSAYTDFITATGFNHRAFAVFGGADIILANILARPLQNLARDLARHVAPGGFVILSGLLPHQQARIVASYRLQGLIYRRRHIRDGWLTLLLQRP